VDQHCCAAALRDEQVIGMPSRAVDEAWHGLILCTMQYQAFCAQGLWKVHAPPSGRRRTANVPAATDPMDEQLRRTVIAWELVAMPGGQCVLWDLDNRVGVDQSWGLDLAQVSKIQAAVAKLRPSARN
jgi:hypothetical protein